MQLELVTLSKYPPKMPLGNSIKDDNARVAKPMQRLQIVMTQQMQH
jgi:hypothetical protein